MRPFIEDFVARRDSLGLHEKPLTLLELMNRELEVSGGNFIDGGVKTQESKTKLKKKFDNMVNEIRFCGRRGDRGDRGEGSGSSEEGKRVREEGRE